MGKSQSFIRILERELEPFPEAGPGRTLMACVSGGADSTALFQGLLEISPRLGFRLVVCHVNHGVRGEEALEDESFVRKLAESAGIRFSLKRLDFKPGEKVSEDKMRSARLSAIRECVGESGAGAAVLGHHRDDLVETFLMRLIQGGGLRGLSGFRGRSRFGDLVLLRPMKNISRQEILSFLKSRNLKWREDRTNRDTNQLRNFIRHDLIGLLEKNVNPGLRSTLSQSSLQFERLSDYIREQAARFLNANLERNGGPTGVEWIPLEALFSLPDFLASEVFRLWIMRKEKRQTPPPFSATEGLVRLSSRGKSGSLIRLPGGIFAFRDYKRILIALKPLPRRLEKAEILEALAPLFLPVQNREIQLPWIADPTMRWTLERKDLPSRNKEKVFNAGDVDLIIQVKETAGENPRDTILIPLKTIRFPLIIRTREEGDGIVIRGIRKSLNKWYGEQRIPLPLRDHLLVVSDEKGILWVAGKNTDLSREIPGKECVTLKWRK